MGYKIGHFTGYNHQIFFDKDCYWTAKLLSDTDINVVTMTRDNGHCN